MPEKQAVSGESRTATHNGHPAETEPAETEQKPGGEESPDNKKDEGNQDEEKPKPPLRERMRGFVHRHPIGVVLGLVLLVLLLIGLFFLLRYFHSYASTDDAFVDGHLNPVTPRIAGTVTAVFVENNQFVKAGEVLATLDPRDYRVALEQARAAYAQAESQVRAENPNVPITQTTTQTTIATGQSSLQAAEAGVAAAQQEYNARLADVGQAEAQNIKAQADVRRYQTLVGKDEISRQQYDNAVAAAASQAAGVQAARASAEAARKALDQRRAQLTQAQTQLSEAQTNAPRMIAVRRADINTRLASAQAAQAQVAQAELNLSYTTIVAQVSGVVTNRTVEIGEHVQAGETLLSISQIDDLWVTANFKETELGRMRPGQDVSIHVDALNEDLKGYVEGMPGASGAATSLLPPENATGNFVKVVQRLPVRIGIKQGEDPQHRLRIGMSVEAKVWL
jgi:membrane fusion protein (multidrug efflux system)